MTALYHNEKQLAVVNTVMIKVAQEVHDVDDDANDERFFVEETFTVPKEKIASVSPFFAAAFNGRFREAKHRCIQLRDTDIDTFREFLVWLEERGDREKPSVSDAHRYSQSDYPELGSMIANVTVKLYVFAHVYNVPRLRNDATDRLYGYFLLSDHDTGGFCITPESVDLVYEHTNDTSGIRNLLVAGYYNRPTAVFHFTAGCLRIMTTREEAVLGGCRVDLVVRVGL
ncbi:hypothetical protein PMIN03_006147 [Paraphaeosphaeria minitans]